MTDNPYERAARLEKATKLVDVLAGAGVDAQTLEQCRPSTAIWRTAARHAGVNLPSLATCALVCEMLRNRARVAKRDPFARFEESL